MKPQPTLLGSRQFFLQALRAFLDLHYLVGDVAVRFAVDGFGCLRARCLKQAENLALVLIEPVPKGLCFMVVLGF